MVRSNQEKTLLLVHERVTADGDCAAMFEAIIGATLVADPALVGERGVGGIYCTVRLAEPDLCGM